MGYSEHKHSGGTITNYWPDEDENTFYLVGCADLQEILNRAEVKWPGISLAQITIEAEYIHTHCLYYDRYDSGDYTNFLKITKNDTA